MKTSKKRSIILTVVLVLVGLWLASNWNYAGAQIVASKSKTEKLASVRLGNAWLEVQNGTYFVCMTDKTNSDALVDLALAGYHFEAGTVVLVLGDLEAATQVLQYLSENKPKKDEDLQITGNERVEITYSGLLGGWQFHYCGMIGNLSRGEAKKFLKALR